MADIEANIVANIEADIEANIVANIVANIEANIVANIVANIEADIEANIVAKLFTDPNKHIVEPQKEILCVVLIFFKSLQLQAVCDLENFQGNFSTDFYGSYLKCNIEKVLKL